jgi:hypothetical protein
LQPIQYNPIAAATETKDHETIPYTSLSPDMKFLLIAFLAFFIVCVSALAPRKQVVITYDSATPDSVIQAAMQAIKDAVGDLRLVWV